LAEYCYQRGDTEKSENWQRDAIEIPQRWRKSGAFLVSFASQEDAVIRKRLSRFQNAAMLNSNPNVQKEYSR